jgi:4a-hydroxytetrahydrobiopterin dehydratase
MSEVVAPPGWDVRNSTLFRKFEFENFQEAFAFMTDVADIAEQQDHHPDWCNSWNTVNISLKSHDVGAITERDIDLASAINALLGEKI